MTVVENFYLLAGEALLAKLMTEEATGVHLTGLAPHPKSLVLNTGRLNTLVSCQK